MIICVLFLAGKDSTSFKLKDKSPDDEGLEEKRINRWHRDGVALNILFIIPFLYYDIYNWHLYLVYTGLIRLVFFDISFNYWAGLNYKFLGSTAWWDQQFIKIFGKFGALKKSLAFLAILILISIL